MKGIRGCCCGDSPYCEHRGYCVHFTACAAPIEGLDVVASVGGATVTSGATDSLGILCISRPREDGPVLPLKLDFEYEDCRLVVTTAGFRLPKPSSGDPCLGDVQLDLCYADVTVRAIDLSTGAEISEARAIATGTAFGTSDLAFSSCTDQPRRLRRVAGLLFPAIDPDSTCDADYTFANAPIPAGNRLYVQVSPTSPRCDGGLVASHIFECPRFEDWCCEDVTFDVGGLPIAGDSQWTAADPCGDAAAWSTWKTCPCRSADDMTFANQGFWPKTLHLAADFRFYPGVADLVEFSADVDLARICRADHPELSGLLGDGWISEEQSVDLKLGVYLCNGVVIGNIRATKVRYVAMEYLGATAVGFVVTETTPDPPTCLPGQFLQVARCPLVFLSGRTPSWQPLACASAMPFDVGSQGGEGCDTHVDWSWECVEPGYGYAAPATCTLYGSASLVGPA